MSSEKPSANTAPDKTSAVSTSVSSDHKIPAIDKWVVDNQKDEAATEGESKLLKFDDSANNSNARKSGKDINKKITALDTDLAHLRTELGTINISVEEGLDRLSDTDTDLTAKVSETYKRLGEIDNAYKSLLEISSRIDHDIQKLNGDVSTVAEVSASGIKHLEKSTIAQSTEFTQKNQQVVSRVNQLVETSKLTGELLQQKVQLTTEKIIQVEQHVVSEIERLSHSTDEKTGSIEESVGSNRAKILKLQSVDEAIIKRATILEISSAELSVKSQELISNTSLLELNTKSLSSELSELQKKTLKLEATTNSHGSLIRSLQSASSKIAHSVAVLSRREDKRLNLIVGSFAFLIIAVAVMFFLQYEKFENVNVQTAQRNNAIDNQVAGLQQEQSMAVVSTSESLTELDNKVTDIKVSMQDELSKELALTDSKMQKMQDKLQSVEGRFNNNTMFSQIGDDNVIHGTQWILSQDNKNYTLQIGLVNDKQTMYELAQSYNHHLKDSLSYFETSSNGVTSYVLLSGSYLTQQQAMEKIDSLPAHIEMKEPVLRTFASVQKYISR